ncbi:MAG: putative metal-binding motif-containing protein [Deltaproteobacteria bacterium]|nr:putative metal-binding motif-containing protein [Deltaproteobacteria bacterium]
MIAASLVACGPTRLEPDVQAPHDSSAESGMDATIAEDSAPDGPTGERCEGDGECDNGLYCDGAERCSGGVCVPGRPPCVNAVSCAMSTCDEDNDRCQTTLDDTMCGDSNACNGVERCDPRAIGADPRTGCTPVRPSSLIDCDDGNNCTVDSCDTRAGCVHSPRDLDGDGFVDRMCTLNGLPSGMQGNDCNDSDALVYPGAPEDCYDGRDNNCNGLADFFDAAANCVVDNDTCATPRALPGPGTYTMAFRGVTNNHNLSCNTTMASDVVYTFTLAAPQDVRVNMATTDVGAAIAVSTTCDPMNFRESACARSVTAGGMTASPTVFLRALPAGTYFLVMESPGVGPYRFSLRFDPPTMFPAGDACPPASAPSELALGAGVPGAPSMVTPLGLTDDFGLSCNPGLPRPDGLLRFTLPTSRNVDLTVSSTTGVNYVSVRRRGGATGSCPGSQIRCQATPSSAAFTFGMRDLVADEYYVLVENSVDAPITVIATASDPASRAAGDACRTAIPMGLTPTRPSTVTATADFSTFLIDADHGTSLTCGSRGSPTGWRDGVYSFGITAETDARITVTPTGGWTPTYSWVVQGTCGDPSSVVGRCNTGSAQGVFTGLAVGTYAVVVETQTVPPAGAGFQVQIVASSPSARPPFEACSGQNIPLSAMGANLQGSVTVNPVTAMLSPDPDHGTICGSGGARGFTDVALNFTIPDARTVSVALTPTGAATWWYEVQDRCGASPPASASRCRESFTPPPAPWTGRLPAGTYSIVAETVTASRGPLTVTVTAAP